MAYAQQPMQQQPQAVANPVYPGQQQVFAAVLLNPKLMQ
jgi:hypothetical protein